MSLSDCDYTGRFCIYKRLEIGEFRAFQRITVIDLFLSQIFEDKSEERLFCGELFIA